MHRFFAAPDRTNDNAFELCERESHHALSVLRARVGERVVVLNGVGAEYLCEITGTRGDLVQLSVRQKSKAPTLPYQLTLVQALTKGKTMDLIVQKAAELGAQRIVPVISERSVPQPDEERVETKLEKWRWTAIDAIKQCGSGWLPTISAPVKPQVVLAGGDRPEMSLVASLQSDALHLRGHFQSFQLERKRKPGSVAVWIGPEGDFTPGEINAIRGAGALPISLGPLVLRSETAAIYALAVINYEMQAGA